MASQYDGRVLRAKLKEYYKVENWIEFLSKLYEEGMSCVEIEEMIYRDAGIRYRARSIQRLMKKEGIIREQKEAFRNAVQRGRVIWQVQLEAERKKGTRHQLDRGLRFIVMERDENKCVLCGASELLQVDHKVARMNGGEDTMENLRTLCIDCNMGKQKAYGEYSKGTLRSGRSIENKGGKGRQSESIESEM